MKFNLTSTLDESVTAIRKFYGENHVLAQDLILLKWMYGNDVGDFNISTLWSENQMVAMIAYSDSEKLEDEPMEKILWGSLWAADPSLPGSGTYLLKRVLNSFPNHSYRTIGASTKAEIIYRALGFTVRRLEHHFIPNTKSKNENLNAFNFPIVKKCLSPESLILSADTVRWFGYRSDKFVRNRYFNHPRFSYEVYCFYDPKPVAYMVGRRIIHPQLSFFRVLEFMHNSSTPNLTNSISNWLKDNNLEFVEFYFYGPNRLQEIGWQKADKQEKYSIPHFVDPLEFREISLSLVSSNEPLWVTRGDGDQDRPNSIVPYSV